MNLVSKYQISPLGNINKEECNQRKTRRWQYLWPMHNIEFNSGTNYLRMPTGNNSKQSKYVKNSSSFFSISSVDFFLLSTMFYTRKPNAPPPPHCYPLYPSHPLHSIWEPVYHSQYRCVCLCACIFVVAKWVQVICTYFYFHFQRKK